MYEEDDEFSPGDLVKFWDNRHQGIIIGSSQHYSLGDWLIAGVDGQRYVVEEHRMEFLTDIPLEILAHQAVSDADV